VCCVGTGLPGPAGNIGVTGHRWRTAYPGLSGFQTFSGAVERSGPSGLYGSRRGMGTTHMCNCFILCLNFTGRMSAGHMPLFRLLNTHRSILRFFTPQRRYVNELHHGVEVDSFTPNFTPWVEGCGCGTPRAVLSRNLGIKSPLWAYPSCDTYEILKDLWIASRLFEVLNLAGFAHDVPKLWGLTTVC